MIRSLSRFSLLVVLLAAASAVGAQPLKRPTYGYTCLDKTKTLLRFPAGRAAQDAFYAKMDSMLLYGTRSVNLWHVGGSHVQADFFSHRMRSNLTELQPDNAATRGFLFPFALAHTNWNHNYSIECTGQWDCGRNIDRGADMDYDFGITGIAATTSDSTATVSFSLNVGQQPSWTFDSLRVMGYGSSDSCYAYVAYQSADSAMVRFHIPTGETFMLTGLVPESRTAGISYFSSGINGAAVPTWLRCVNLAEDLKVVRPDIVFFAIGVNDAAVPYGKFDSEAFKAGYRRIIAMVEAVSPGCAYVFITNNDTYYRQARKRPKTPNPNAKLVQKAFYELAEEYDGAVWDVFDFMGGMGSSMDWRDEGLMANDLIHFTRTGYELLGDLLFNALIDDWMGEKEKSEE